MNREAKISQAFSALDSFNVYLEKRKVITQEERLKSTELRAKVVEAFDVKVPAMSDRQIAISTLVFQAFEELAFAEKNHRENKSVESSELAEKIKEARARVEKMVCDLRSPALETKKRAWESSGEGPAPPRNIPVVPPQPGSGGAKEPARKKQASSGESFVDLTNDSD